MDDERQLKNLNNERTSKDERESGRTFEISARSLGAWLATIALALILGVGGYLVGKNGGEDLEQAKTEGVTAGTKIGSTKGAAKGYTLGLKQGERVGYQSSYGSAYKQAYAGAIANAGLERPQLRTIGLPGE